MSKYRPQRKEREKTKFRCANKNCRAELLDADEKLDGYCHKCSLKQKFKKRIERAFKDDRKN